MMNTVIEGKTEIIKFTVTESKKFKQSGMKIRNWFRNMR